MTSRRPRKLFSLKLNLHQASEMNFPWTPISFDNVGFFIGKGVSSVDSSVHWSVIFRFPDDLVFPTKNVDGGLTA